MVALAVATAQTGPIHRPESRGTVAARHRRPERYGRSTARAGAAVEV